jgi:hypothetical protein
MVTRNVGSGKLSQGFAMKNVFATLCLLTLAGCMEVQPVATSAVNVAPPSNARAAALGYARQNFFDPFSVRDASISQPFVIPYGLGGQSQAWVVCVRANAKNRMGAYAGMQETLIVFSGDTVDVSRSGRDVASACRSAQYGPFAELEALS